MCSLSSTFSAVNIPDKNALGILYTFCVPFPNTTLKYVFFPHRLLTDVKDSIGLLMQLQREIKEDEEGTASGGGADYFTISPLFIALLAFVAL